MKIIPPLRNSETNAPQKILMIRFETKTWLMENQVKLSCFSPVSVHLEIWLQLFWRLLDQISQDLTREAAAEAGRLYSYTKRAFTGENTLNYQSDDRRHEEIVWNKFISKVRSFRGFRKLSIKYDTVGLVVSLVSTSVQEFIFSFLWALQTVLFIKS